MENELEDGQQVLVEEGQQEQQEQDEGTDADFDAGFAGTPTETPEKPAASSDERAQAQEPTAATENQAQTDAQPTETPAAPKYVQITETEFNSLKALPQRLDQAFGKIGGVERIMQSLQTQQSRHPSGEPLKLSEADFAELKTEFPELADLHIKGMQRVLERISMPGADPQAIERVVGERTAAVRTEMIDSHLDAIFATSEKPEGSDWRKEVSGPQYLRFMESQPGWRPEYANKEYRDSLLADPDSELSIFIKANPTSAVALADSQSLRDAATLMRKFKTFRDTPPPTQAQPTQAAAPNVKSRAIAAAVPPKGNQAVTRQPTADDEFESGFKTG